MQAEGLVVLGHIQWQFMRILHEFLANATRLGAHGRTEHHYLLLLWSLNEDLLHIFPHVKLIQALVTFIKHKLCELVQLQVLLTQQTQYATWSANEDVRTVVPQHITVLGNGHAAIDNSSLHVLEVLCKSIEFVLDLVS